MLPFPDSEALLRAEHGDPFAVLGPHAAEGGPVVRVLLPGAEQVEVLDAGSGEVLGTLERTHADGLFAGTVSRSAPYRLRVRWSAGDTTELEDPYRFPPVLGEMDVYLLAEGTHLTAYEKLGAHPVEMDGVAGTSFAVWAPNARRVSVIGEFNLWDGRRHPMRLQRGCGVWEIFVPGVAAGTHYKYEVLGADGAVRLKADPYALAAEKRPQTASIVAALPRADQSSPARNDRMAPIAIYEVHLGSWRRGEGNRFLTYAELAEQLPAYVKEMGFTHIELLPVSEHPFDGSWGYQPTGMFAATSRFGPPEDFARLVDACHAAGLGVILDWVPGHFPNDAHGLANFDGTHLYEHADPREGRHMDWDTLIYNHGRREVSNFLLASGLFWMDRYQIDGLRVDAVASMLYRDYSRRAGEWIPNQFGGRENLEAVAFFRRLNELAYEAHPEGLTVAEESTAWPMVSRPTSAGGLGFGYKWNMGWMHDTLAYMANDPVHRRYHHDQMTFGMVYAYNETFILPLSHDEVVHGKGSLLGKMPGDTWQKFANLRAYYTFMYAHPGKKLLFMGCEFAQGREWNHDQSLDWHLLQDPMHAGMQRLVGDLNRTYAAETALHQLDDDPAGFAWIEGGDRANSVLSFLRRGQKEGDFVVAVCNFTPIVRPGFRIGVPAPGFYQEIVNSDGAIYGGSNVGNHGGLMADEVPAHGHPYSLDLTLPPLAGMIFKPGQAS